MASEAGDGALGSARLDDDAHLDVREDEFLPADHVRAAGARH
jgi:hypothetical protein